VNVQNTTEFVNKRNTYHRGVVYKSRVFPRSLAVMYTSVFSGQAYLGVFSCLVYLGVSSREYLGVYRSRLPRCVAVLITSLLTRSSLPRCLPIVFTSVLYNHLYLGPFTSVFTSRIYRGVYVSCSLGIWQ
jgi:hypothetical protein